jgi:hypothetical protein
VGPGSADSNFLATLAIRQQTQTIQFRSAAEMLDSFGMQQGGTQYRRLVAAFHRIFGATIFFGTDSSAREGLSGTSRAIQLYERSPNLVFPRRGSSHVAGWFSE